MSDDPECIVCHGSKEMEVQVIGTDTAWVECHHCKIEIMNKTTPEWDETAAQG